MDRGYALTAFSNGKLGYIMSKVTQELTAINTAKHTKNRRDTFLERKRGQCMSLLNDLRKAKGMLDIYDRATDEKLAKEIVNKVTPIL